MSIDFLFRLIGMVVFSVIGVFVGLDISNGSDLTSSKFQFTAVQISFTLGLVGALIGLVLTPYITTRPFRALRALMKRLSAQVLNIISDWTHVRTPLRSTAGFSALAAAQTIWINPSFRWGIIIRLSWNRSFQSEAG